MTTFNIPPPLAGAGVVAGAVVVSSGVDVAGAGVVVVSHTARGWAAWAQTPCCSAWSWCLG